MNQKELVARKWQILGVAFASSTFFGVWQESFTAAVALLFFLGTLAMIFTIDL